MNFSNVIPHPNISVNRPIKISTRGNVYKIPIIHTDNKGNTINNYEVWATKEAIQKHFGNVPENPKEYQMRKFARQMYERRLRTGRPPEKGMFVSSNQTTHGNPNMWPNNLIDPEAKI